MAIQIQLRSGTTLEHNTFTGAVGELPYDTEKKQLRVHDGSTVGGKVVDDPTRNVTSQVSNATETTTGKAEIATQAETNTGTDDLRIVTPKKLLAGVKNHLNASGEAPISAIRSYVIGSAIGAPTILRGMNVASVTKPSSNQLTINFIKPMPDINYIVLAYSRYGAAPNEFMGGVAISKTVSSCTINLRMPAYQSDNSPEYTVVIL